MTISAFLSPFGLPALLLWCFVVLSAAQLTIRLIMAFSIRQTIWAALLLALLALPIAWLYDLAMGSDPAFGTRLTWAPLPILLMACAGFVCARWVLRIRRLRGQLVAAAMVGILAPQLFTLAPG